MKFKEFVISDLHSWASDGQQVALATLVNVDGSTPRRVGSQVAVNENGDYVGSISGGCAEAAIVDAACRAIRDKANRIERYGEGSPYVDIKLPCGAGIDVFVDSSLSLKDIETIMSRRQQRKFSFMQINLEDLSSRVSVQKEDAGGYLHTYLPSTRLIVAGRGPILTAVVDLCRLLEYEVLAFSPEQDLLDSLGDGVQTHHLSAPEALSGFDYDRLTALCVLFHDHEWEPEILRQALDSDAFYVGALGSRLTHIQRKQLLTSMQLDQATIERIFAPIGVDIAANGPHQIALAIAAELVEQRNQLVYEP